MIRAFLGVLLATLFVQTAQAQGYVQFVDPREGAFSIDVPAGWNVEGGTLRRSPLATNFVLHLSSPDGSEEIKIGDPDILPYTAPGPMVPPQGSKYPVGQGVVLIVEPYMTGTQYAQVWGGSVLRRSCRELRKLSAGEVTPPHGDAQSRSGQAVFACDRNIAYVFATTRLTTDRNICPLCPINWEAPDAIIGLARPEQIRHTVATIFHMIGTAKINPQWQLGQLQRSGVAREQAQQSVSRLMQRQEQESINTPGSTAYQIDQAIRGYTSTEGGHEVEIQGRGNYYWNCKNQYGEERQVNTQSYMSPGPNCTRIP
jgi:hypothetical protein